MLFNKVISLIAVGSLVLVQGAPAATLTAPLLVKRDQLVLTDSVWTSTSSGVAILVTPTLIDGVTLSASPIESSATPWVSLDGSGIPIGVTPTVSGGSTISASPTPTATDYPSASGVPPVLRCFGDRVPDEDASLGYPFCTALNGSEWLVGEVYWITWDPTYWGGSDITRVKLSMISYPIKDDDTPIWTSDYINNANGYYPLEILSKYRRSSTSGYFFLQISPLASPGSNAKHTGAKTGPLLRIINNKQEAVTTISRLPSDNGIDSSSSSNSKSGSSNAKVIAPAVVVPVVVVFAIAIGVIYFIKTRKANDGGVLDSIGGAIRLKRTSGYGQGSKAQRTGTAVNTEHAESTDNETDAASFVTRDGASTIMTEEMENPFRG